MLFMLMSLIIMLRMLSMYMRMLGVIMLRMHKMCMLKLLMRKRASVLALVWHKRTSSGLPARGALLRTEVPWLHR